MKPEKSDNYQDQAMHFRRVRHAHSKEVAEDYTELIFELQQKNGYVRPSDLSISLGVSRATVTRTLARLRQDGLVISGSYKNLELSEAGVKLAKDCAKRHKIVYEFLLAIGVDEESARSDAEGLEHHVGENTLNRMLAIINERRIMNG